MVLTDEDILNRFVLKKSFIRPDGSIDAKAFLLKQKDEGRLSTFREVEMAAAACAQSFNPAYGCAAFPAGAIKMVEAELKRGIRAEYDPVPSDSCPGHTSILNLPNPDDEDEAIFAERAASLLRDSSQRVLL